MDNLFRTLVFFIAVGGIFGIEKVKDPSVARPRKVVAEVENSNTIKLSWQPPRITEKNCPVKRYLIRLRNEVGKGSKTWKIDGARLSVSLHDLNEDTDYSIRLMAVTCEGKGARTRWITVRTGISERPHTDDWEETPANSEDNVPGKATYVRTRTFTNSVILSWQPPDGDIIVRGYKVGYSEGVPDLNWRYVDASKRNITIENLKPASQYVISICAFNNYGEGQVEYELVYTREGDGPTVNPLSPPENVRAKVLSPSTAWLQWYDPSLGRTQKFTDERYYNVHYQAMPNGKQLSMIVKALHVVLYDLTPGTMYSFKVRTVKDAHASPFSESVNNKTFETAPDSAPRSLTVLSTNDSSTVHLSWRPPRQPNGHITAYLVLYTTDQKQPLSTWDVFAVAGPNTEVIMSTLKPNMTYYFKVNARNSKGHGPTSNTLVYHTTSVSDHDDIHVKDNAADDFEDYEFDDDENTISDDRGDYFASFSDGGREVALRDSYDSSSPKSASRTQHSTLPLNDSPDTLDVAFQTVVKHTVSAVITWRLPCYDVAPKRSPVKYTVRYYPVNAPDSYTEKSTPTNFVLLDNLRPNTLYKYKVNRMVKDTGGSVWSKEGLLNTNYPSGES